MDLLRRRRPAIGAGGHAGGQGDLSEGRQGQDQLVQAGETADQALDRLIVEDLRRGALRRSRSVPPPTSGPGLRRLTDAGDETARMGSAGSRDGIPPPPGIAQGPGGQGAPGLVVNPVEGPRPGLGDRGIPGEGAHPGRLGEGALRQGHHPGEGQRPGPGDQGWQDDGGRGGTYGQVRPLTLWPVDEHGPDQEQRGNGSAGRGRRPEGVAGAAGGWQWVPHAVEAQWQGWDNRGGNGEPLQQPPQVNPFWSPEVQRRAIAAGMPVAESQGGFVGSPQRPEPGSQGRSQQAVDVEGLRRRIMKEAEEAFQLELNRLNQAGGSYSDEASFRTAQSDPIPPPPPPPPPPRGMPPEVEELRAPGVTTSWRRHGVIAVW